MKFCKKCGTQLADHASFCPKCGNAVESQAAPSYVQPTPVQPAPSFAQPAPKPVAPIYQQADTAQDVPEYAQPKPVVEAPAYVQPVAPVYEPKKVATISNDKPVVILGFIYKLLTIVALFWLALAVFTVYIRVSVDAYYSSGYYGYYFDTDAYGWAYWDETYTSLAMSFSIAAFGLAVATFIVTLVKRLGMKRVFDVIVKMFGAAVLIALSIVALTY